MAPKPVRPVKRCCLLSFAAAGSLSFLLTPRGRRAGDTVVLPAHLHAARCSRRSRVPLAQQSGSEFAVAGRDGRTKRLVVQRRMRDAFRPSTSRRTSTR